MTEKEKKLARKKRDKWLKNNPEFLKFQKNLIAQQKSLESLLLPGKELLKFQKSIESFLSPGKEFLKFQKSLESLLPSKEDQEKFQTSLESLLPMKEITQSLKNINSVHNPILTGVDNIDKPLWNRELPSNPLLEMLKDIRIIIQDAYTVNQNSFNVLEKSSSLNKEALNLNEKLLEEISKKVPWYNTLKWHVIGWICAPFFTFLVIEIIKKWML